MQANDCAATFPSPLSHEPPPFPQHHHGIKRKEHEAIQVQHETQGANKKPRVVWSVEMHQQVGPRHCCTLPRCGRLVTLC